MNQFKGCISYTFAAFLILFDVSRASGAQVAPDKAPVLICTDGLHEFRQSLENIARLDHVGFVVEGEPHPIVLLERAARDSPLPGATLSQGAVVSVRERVTQVAASFDYSATKVGFLFLLRKRHTFPADIPDVTPEECYIASREMHEMLRALSHDFVPHEQTQLFDGLVSSLTPDQWRTIETNHCLRTNGDLSEEQRDMLLAFVVHMYSIPGLGFENMPTVLNPELLPRFSRGTSPDGSQQSGVGTTNNYGTVTRVDFLPIVMGTGPVADAMTIASEAVAEADGASPQSVFYVCTTIGTAVDNLNKRSQLGTHSTADSLSSFAVASAFGSKPVTLVGEAIASPEDVASAIAAVYGLGLQRTVNQPNTRNITRLQIPKLEHPSDAGQIAHQILPAPFLTALQVDQEDVLRAMPVFNRAANQEQADRMRRKWDLNELILQHRTAAICSAARQLRAVLDKVLPRVAAGEPQDAATLPFATASTYLQSLFVTYTLRDFAMLMDGILYPPLTVSRFEQTSLTCVPDYTNPKKPTVNVTVNVIDPRDGGPGRPVLGTSVVMDLRKPDATVKP